MDLGKYVSSYLRADSFMGQPAQNLTIASVEIEEIGQDKEEKPVLYFEELELGMVLNKTNITRLEEMSIARGGTRDSDDWIGMRVQMYHDPEIAYAGKRVGGLRFREAPAAKGTKKKGKKKGKA